MTSPLCPSFLFKFIPSPKTPKSRELPERGGLLVKNNIAAELTKYILPEKKIIKYKLMTNKTVNGTYELYTINAKYSDIMPPGHIVYR